MLHGEVGSAQQARDDYGWNDLADRDGFVVIYPDSVGNSWNVSPSCCGQAHSENVNDVGYLHQLDAGIGTVGGSLAIDCPIVAPVALAAVGGSADLSVRPATTGAVAAGVQGNPSLESTLARFRTLDRSPDQPAGVIGSPVSQRFWTCIATRTVSWRPWTAAPRCGWGPRRRPGRSPTPRPGPPSGSTPPNGSGPTSAQAVLAESESARSNVRKL